MHPTPPKLARLTQQGTARILGSKAGQIYPIDMETPSTPPGKYTVAHVRDAGGHLWSLGDGDWEPVNQDGRGDREELVLLRISLARVAQKAGAEFDHHKVLEQGYNELATMAREKDRGWNALAAAIIDKLDDNVLVDKSNNWLFKEALHLWADRNQMGDGEAADAALDLAKAFE